MDLKRYSYLGSKQIWISLIKKYTQQLFGSLGSQKILSELRDLKKVWDLQQDTFNLPSAKGSAKILQSFVAKVNNSYGILCQKVGGE